jgi:hypothetical protein
MSIKSLLKCVKARIGKCISADRKCDRVTISNEGKESSPPVVLVRPARARGLQREETTSFIPPVEVLEFPSAPLVNELPGSLRKKLKAKSSDDWADFYLSSLRKLANPYAITSTGKSSLRKGKLRFTAAEYQAEIGECFHAKPVVSFHSLTS